jgi:hypothetical protein
MPRHEAVKALDIYKRAGQQAGSLSDFYEICKGLELARNFQFPVLREPPQSFLNTMEEYIGEAPRVVNVPNEPLLQLTYRPDEGTSEDGNLTNDEREPEPVVDDVAVSNVEAAPAPPLVPLQNNADTGDLLGLSFDAHAASAIEDSNALALAMVPTDSAPTFNSGASQSKDFDPSGWELALVTAPSTNISSATERQLAGGMDSLTLNSLYDEGAYRAAQQPAYGAPAPNPFEVQDPFFMSNNVAPSASVQMAQQQANPFGSYAPAYQQPFPQQQNFMMNQSNPFGDPSGLGNFQVNHPHQQNHNNPFGTAGLI